MVVPDNLGTVNKHGMFLLYVYVVMPFAHTDARSGLM